MPSESRVRDAHISENGDLTTIPVPGLYSFCFARPQSITYLMPGIVSDVSAIFVARMTLRVLGPAGWNALTCCTGERAAYSGQTLIYTIENIQLRGGISRNQKETVRTFICSGLRSAAYCFIEACRFSISSWPVRKMRTSPGGRSTWIWKNVLRAASM
jgi:hypothetical protein